MNYIETIRAEHGDAAAKIAEEAMETGARITRQAMELAAAFYGAAAVNGHHHQANELAAHKQS